MAGEPKETRNHQVLSGAGVQGQPGHKHPHCGQARRRTRSPAPRLGAEVSRHRAAAQTSSSQGPPRSPPTREGTTRTGAALPPFRHRELRQRALLERHGSFQGKSRQ